MAMAGRSDLLIKLNPLRCSGGALPLRGLLAAKLLILYVIFSKAPGGSNTVAPFLSFLEFVPYPDTIRFVLKLGIALASLAVLFNLSTRPALIFIGVSSLVIICWSRLNYSNNQLFLALVLIILGLHNKGDSFWGVRTTTGLLYFGAGLNKLMNPDWQSGEVMRFWLQEDMQVWWLDSVQLVWNSPTLFTGLAWLVIFLELFLAGCFLVPKFVRGGVIVGFLFHAGMLVATGGVISHLFMFLMISVYLIFIPWPEKGKYKIVCGNPFYALRWLDFDKQFTWELDNRNSSGLVALAKVLFFLPAIWVPAGAAYALYIFGWP
jgi:hypothetical protein